MDSKINLCSAVPASRAFECAGDEEHSGLHYFDTLLQADIPDWSSFHYGAYTLFDELSLSLSPESLGTSPHLTDASLSFPSSPSTNHGSGLYEDFTIRLEKAAEITGLPELHDVPPSCAHYSAPRAWAPQHNSTEDLTLNNPFPGPFIASGQDPFSPDPTFSTRSIRHSTATVTPASLRLVNRPSTPRLPTVTLPTTPSTSTLTPTNRPIRACRISRAAVAPVQAMNAGDIEEDDDSGSEYEPATEGIAPSSKKRIIRSSYKSPKRVGPSSARPSKRTRTLSATPASASASRSQGTSTSATAAPTAECDPDSDAEDTDADADAEGELDPDLLAATLGSFKCPSCPYVQLNRRKPDLKRHMRTHAQFKDLRWKCHGVKGEDGKRRGGCGEVYSRRDALKRHLDNKKNKNRCVGDMMPCTGSEDE